MESFYKKICINKLENAKIELALLEVFTKWEKLAYFYVIFVVII